MTLPSLNLLKLNDSIFAQLQLEEALLRADDKNWCIINSNSSPAIVMGISGKPELLINQQAMLKHPLPVIRRFSGGGTVVVDEQTLFVTLICNSTELKVDCCPQKVSKWTENVYARVFPNLNFRLMENDYVLGQKKFGGNAQYMRKERWLHHSSLLWDFQSDHMEYLLFPPKVPAYREKREHNDFLCSLKEHFCSLEDLKRNVIDSLKYEFHIQEMSINEAEKILQKPHRKATAFIRPFAKLPLCLRPISST